jgi:hypothetical protein
MKEIFKPVSSIEGLEINHDGTIVYYQEKLKNICYTHTSKNGKKYKYINIKGKVHFISRLVFEAWINKLPPIKKIIFIDGNHLNTNYKNLGPKTCPVNKLVHMKKVPGYDELLINNNGTIVSQFGFEVNITLHRDFNRPDRKNREVPSVCIHSHKGAQFTYIGILVARAFLGFNGHGKVLHRDGNVKNNHYKNLQVFTLKQYGKWASQFMAARRPEGQPSKIPKSDIDKVKKRLLKGDTLRMIANDYNCTDMSIVRFKKRYFTKEEIDLINKNNGINTNHTPKYIVEEIVAKLKKGERQINLSKEYNLSPTVICRINRKYIKNGDNNSI